MADTMPLSRTDRRLLASLLIAAVTGFLLPIALIVDWDYGLVFWIVCCSVAGIVLSTTDWPGTKAFVRLAFLPAQALAFGIVAYSVFTRMRDEVAFSASELLFSVPVILSRMLADPFDLAGRLVMILVPFLASFALIALAGLLSRGLGGPAVALLPVSGPSLARLDRLFLAAGLIVPALMAIRVLTLASEFVPPVAAAIPSP